MVKIQQYKIIKFESERLKEFKNRVSLTFSEAEENGEIVSLADSELLRIIRRLTGKEYAQFEIESVLKERKKLSRLPNSKAARKTLNDLDSQIERMIFIPEIVIVFFDNKKHYSAIIRDGGFYLNKKKYVPLLSGAGMMRRSSVMFIDESLRDPVDEILNNGRNQTVEINPAKFGSYYALSSSASTRVSFPRLAVVPDKVIKTRRLVSFGEYDGKEGVDPTIEEREMDIDCNAFDGQGIISPELARTWSRDLGLDYILSSAIIRASWIKGMVVTFPIHEFAKEISPTDFFTDIYGNEININDVDCIISESMFKLWSAYSSTKEYVDACRERDFGFGISRVSPKINKTSSRTSYQFIQVLDINKDDIDELIEPTIRWFDDVGGMDWNKVILYLMGEQEFSSGWFGRLEPFIRAMLLNKNTVSDPYSRSKLAGSLDKKKQDAKLGRLLIRGCYSTMVSDPYAQMAHVFGMDDFLLRDGEHFSHYWNERGIKNVAAIRSPIVHSSEVNKLNFVTDEKHKKWYRYIKTGVVYPCYGIGIDPAIHSGSDFDGDEVCTFDSDVFLRGRSGGLPILYESKKAPKVTIEDSFDERIHQSQIHSFGTRIGYYTNVCSSMWALMPMYDPGTIEHETLKKRLQYFRILQGEEIDSAKTGNVSNYFPEHFVKYRRITDEMTPDEIEMWKFNNSILSDKRPEFMRWLYPDYQRKYRKELSIFDSISKTKWGISISDLFQLEEKNEEQKALIARYKKRSFFISNDSVMNMVSRRVEEKLLSLHRKKQPSEAFDHRIYLSKGFSKPSKINLDKMTLLFKEYQSYRRTLRRGHIGFQGKHNRQDGEFDDGLIMRKRIWRKAYSTISSNASEIGDLAVHWAYVHSRDKSSFAFIWSCFGEEIISNMVEKEQVKSVRVPQKSEKGTIEYLWDRYAIFNVSIMV